jgi:hypothetical protein
LRHAGECMTCVGREGRLGAHVGAGLPDFAE